jgi:cytochrome P450
MKAFSLQLYRYASALLAIPRVSIIVLRRLLQGEGSLSRRLKPLALDLAFQREVFALLRGFAPNIYVAKPLIRAYANSGTALVCRNSDVREVLDRHQDFEVVYGPRMEAVTGGYNFFLGMQDGPTYSRDVSNMRLAVRRTDPEQLLVPLAQGWAEQIIGGCGGQLDLPQQLGQQIPALMVQQYFGIQTPQRQQLIDWTTLLFWYLFVDLAADPDLDRRALEAGEQLRNAIDHEIQLRKASAGAPAPADDVLQRLLGMQAAALPGLDDLGIRNYLFGFLIGAIPTLSAAASQIIEVLLDRPAVLAEAQAAARSQDQQLLDGYIFEAFRFAPLNPVIYRRAVRKTTIARGSWRARSIPAGTMVLASNLSAMFDPIQVQHANRFWPQRPWYDYILWGYGMHTCAGAYINRALLPVMLRPLLCQANLRRAPGAAGQIDRAGTPFPVHQQLRFDATS